MINTIIFSKDRAMTLRLLLESIQRNAMSAFNVNVLYSYSNEEFKSGYEKLQAENILPRINWVVEEDFKKQTLGLLDRKYTLDLNYEYCCFFMDDDIVYKKFEIEKIYSTLKNDQEVFCFSLRLGKNTTECYSMNAKNVIILSSEEEGIIKWDWSKHYMDFGFPLSIHGHIFRTREIMKLTNNVRFTNPNSLEEAWQIYDNYPKEKMASFEHNVYITGPLWQRGEPALNQCYLSGQTINYESMDTSKIDSFEPKIHLQLTPSTSTPIII